MSHIHLSETGFNAGRRFCTEIHGKSVHAAFAPLSSELYRSVVCPDCLRTWAFAAYEEGDETPLWVIKLRLAPSLDFADTPR